MVLEKETDIKVQEDKIIKLRHTLLTENEISKWSSYIIRTMTSVENQVS